MTSNPRLYGRDDSWGWRAQAGAGSLLTDLGGTFVVRSTRGRVTPQVHLPLPPAFVPEDGVRLVQLLDDATRALKQFEADGEMQWPILRMGQWRRQIAERIDWGEMQSVRSVAIPLPAPLAGLPAGPLARLGIGGLVAAGLGRYAAQIMERVADMQRPAYRWGGGNAYFPVEGGIVVDGDAVLQWYDDTLGPPSRLTRFYGPDEVGYLGIRFVGFSLTDEEAAAYYADTFVQTMEGSAGTIYGTIPSVVPNAYVGGYMWASPAARWTASTGTVSIVEPAVLPLDDEFAPHVPLSWAAAALRDDASPWSHGRTASNGDVLYDPPKRLPPPPPVVSGAVMVVGEAGGTAAGVYVPPAGVGVERSRERKIRHLRSQTTGNGFSLARSAQRTLEAMTETGDAIGALFNALPPDIRRAMRREYLNTFFGEDDVWDFGHSKRPPRELPVAWQLRALQRHWREIDPMGAVRELAWETVSDTVYGLMGRASVAAQERAIRRFATNVSPGFEHPLSPQLPLQDIGQQITGRFARENRQRREREYLGKYDVARAIQAGQDRRARVAQERRRFKESLGGTVQGQVVRLK